MIKPIHFWAMCSCKRNHPPLNHSASRNFLSLLLGIELFSIFPDLLKKTLEKCCHPNSTVSFAKLLLTQAVSTDNTDYDLYMPLYGNSMDDTKFKDNPFIPALQAPTIALIVFSDDIKKGNTQLMIMTILKKVPLLVFIMLTASASGIFVWFLVRYFTSAIFMPYVVLAYGVLRAQKYHSTEQVCWLNRP